MPKGKIDNESYQAKLDNLDLSSAMINEPGEKVKTFSSARLEDSQRVSPNEPYQAKLDNKKQTINEDTVDLTEPLKWSLIKKSELGDVLTTLEPSETSGMSSSDSSFAILEINNLLKLTHVNQTIEPIHSNHNLLKLFTTPMIDPWLHEVEINDDAKVIQPEK